MKNSTLTLSVVAVLGIGTLMLTAGEETIKVKKSGTHAARSAETRPDAIPDEQPIGRTIKLTFSMTNDDGKHSIPLVCAARSFHSERDVVEADGGHQFKIAGYLKAVDAKDRVFVYFDVLRYHSNDTEGVNATFKLKGSVIATFGKKIEIGALGEEKITLTATVVE